MQGIKLLLGNIYSMKLGIMLLSPEDTATRRQAHSVLCKYLALSVDAEVEGHKFSVHGTQVSQNT